MTKQDLLELLEEIDDEEEVRLMLQMNYPLESRISCGYLWDPQDNDPEDESDEGFKSSEPPKDPEARILYLCEGIQVGYGYRGAWR